ncbi:MAG TPA: BBP7 family outer membrane beta-barrel protein [Thermoguttaceae bacterium]|nr:BBP7 family outer membrane beta-barrel protein [Thermoguttaceae bacterium]
MARHILATATVLIAAILVPCLAHAQNQRGYWDRGQWIGYMPPHLKYANAAGQQPDATAASQQADDTADVESLPPTADRAGANPTARNHQLKEPTSQASAVRPVQYTRAVQPTRNRNPRSSMYAARRPAVRGGVARASNEVMEPIPMGEPVQVAGPEVEQPGMAAPGCGCGGAGCSECCGPEMCDSCGCDPCGCGPCDGYECGLGAVCRPRWLWGRAEYLGWWTSGMHLPALVTTSTTGLPTLDNANTSVLLGDGEVNSEGRSGGRFALGMWLDPCATRGVEFTYFRLATERASFYADDEQYTRLGRPFFNIDEGVADAHLISYPDTAAGWVAAEIETQFQGAEVLYRRATKRCPASQVDFLIGWRWLQLKDNLFINEQIVDGEGTLSLYDRFDTKNNFNGIEFGFDWTRPLSCYWTFEAVGKLALGSTHSVITTDGSQSGAIDQGLLALDSNSGVHKRASLSSVAEIGLSLKRRFCCGLEATFGYTFVYWSDVMRAGDQVDLDLDLRQVPTGTATHPGVPMDSTDFWAQGLHFGLEYPF